MGPISVKLAVVFGMLPIVCEAITEIIGASELFAPLREFIIRKEIPFLKGLLECKYCLSVWVAAFLVIVCWWSAGVLVFNRGEIFFLMLCVFIVHRMSNILHLVFDIVSEYKINRWTITING
jgi:hypothetical protein